MNNETIKKAEKIIEAAKDQRREAVLAKTRAEAEKEGVERELQRMFSSLEEKHGVSSEEELKEEIKTLTKKLDKQVKDLQKCLSEDEDAVEDEDDSDTLNLFE